MTEKDWLKNNKLGIDIFNRKYRFKEESFEQWLKRVSGNNEAVEKLIRERKFLFGGRTLTSRGTGNGLSFSNCYSSGYAPDSVKGMLELNTNLALTYQSSGGQGLSLSRVRPKGADVRNGLFKSDGIVPFMEIFNQTTESISQGGSRKGALMMSLSIWHPEIETFISIKDGTGKITKANLSVELDDEFMKLVENNVQEYEYTVFGIDCKINPTELYNKIMKRAWSSAEPGVIFTNKFRLRNLMEFDGEYKIVTSNPCFHPDTIIETTEGKVKIKDMNKPMKVYSMDKDGKLVIKQATPSWVTRKNADTLILHISNGEQLCVTPNHMIYIKNRGWVEAKDIQINDIPVAFLRKRRGSSYSGIRLSTQLKSDEVMEHRFVYESEYGTLLKDEDVHHLDGNTYNNNFHNLQKLGHSEHATLTRFSCDNNHMVQCKKTGKFITHEGSMKGKKEIIPMPIELSSNFKTIPRITKIEKGEITDVYDITVEDTHNLVANGIIAHNCGEQPLPANSACNLGSMNLLEYVENPFTKDARIDFNMFYNDVQTCIEALDDVLEEGKDLHALPEQREMANNYRNVGLGLMGVASALMALGIPYGNKKSIDLISAVSRTMFYSALNKSALLAKEKGSFPKCDKEAILKSNILKETNVPDSILELIKEHGLRNCSLLSIAPSGSIGTMLDISTGLEPYYALKYMRKTETLHGDKDVYYEVEVDVAKKAREVFGNRPCVSALNIDWKNRVRLQGAMQFYVDTAISSTVNVREDITVDELRDLYIYSWREGLKGITIYRENSFQAVLSTEPQKNEDETILDRGIMSKVPEDTIYYPREMNHGCGKAKVMVGYSPSENRITDVYHIEKGKGGCSKNTQGEAILISQVLRLGGNLEDIKKSFGGIGACTSCTVSRMKGNTVDGINCPNILLKIVLDAKEELVDKNKPSLEPKNKVEEVKKEIVKENTEIDNKYICPECNAVLHPEGACFTCTECGYSKCE